MTLADEDGAEFKALEAALLEELAPVGALQYLLAQRIAVAAWRLSRADRIEAELFSELQGRDGSLGLALIRDGHGARALPTLLRYRGAALAELMRSLRALEALQAEAREPLGVAAEAAVPAPAPLPAVAAGVCSAPLSAAREENPNEPERRRNPGVTGRSGERANPEDAPAGSDPNGARVCHPQRPMPPPETLASQPIEARSPFGATATSGCGPDHPTWIRLLEAAEARGRAPP